MNTRFTMSTMLYSIPEGSAEDEEVSNPLSSNMSGSGSLFVERMVILGDTGVTPWHPVRVAEGAWDFPANLAPPTMFDGNVVSLAFTQRTGFRRPVAFASEDAPGVQYVALAHGMKGNVVEHEYFGTERCIENLRSHADERGVVVVDSAKERRALGSDRVVGFF